MAVVSFVSFNMRTVLCLAFVLALAFSTLALEEEEEDPSRPGQDLEDDNLTNGPLVHRKHRHEKSRNKKVTLKLLIEGAMKNS